MKPFDRLLLLLYTAAVTIMVTGLIPMTLGRIYPYSVWYHFDFISARWPLYLTFFIILILAGLRLSWAGVRPSSGRQAVVHDGALGQVRIALSAIESLVEKVVAENNGIKDVKAKVRGVPQGIGIVVKIAATHDINIPEVSNIIQQQVKENVYNVTGVSVQDVRIMVASITAQKPRVE